MNELQLPVCALVFSILICVIFFSKERVRKTENKVYGIMLICGVVDSLLVCIERLLVLSGNMNDVTPLINVILQITNKIDFAALIVITSCLFLYTVLITLKNVNYQKLKKAVITIDILTYVVISFLSVSLICQKNIISVTGTALIPTFILCGLYLIGAIIITVFNIKNFTSKHIPIISIIFIFIFLMFIFSYNPYIVIISIALTFVNYLMYFTIENPDLKLIDELTKTKNLAEKYNNDKSIFLFNMTQQIRNPLNNIEQLTDKIFESDNLDDIKQDVLDIRNAEKKISYVINGALDVTTMDVKKIKVVKNKYNINNFLTEISLRAEQSASKKNLEFRKNFDSALPSSLYGDVIRLKQIVNALLSNSIKYTEHGFVELNVNSIISFDVCRLIISVKDSGIGMKTEDINKLFSSNDDEELDIYDVDDSDITLDIAKKMVNLIGGTITVQSEKNKGSEFTIIIDQKIANDNNSVMDIVDDYEKLNIKKRILFVGKDKEESEFIKKKLSSDFDISVSNSKENFLTRMRKKEECDLIILKSEEDKLSLDDIILKLENIKSFNIPLVVLVDSIEQKENITAVDKENIISKDSTYQQVKNFIDSKINR